VGVWWGLASELERGRDKEIWGDMGLASELERGRDKEIWGDMGLASELECGRDELLCGALEDLGARRGRASETELGDAVAARQRRPRLVAVALRMAGWFL